MSRPIVRHATYQNDRWAVGAKVSRPWRRALATAALWLGRIAVLAMGIAVALIAWDLVLRKLLGGIGNGAIW